MKEYLDHIDTYVTFLCEPDSVYAIANREAGYTTMRLFIPPRFPYLDSLIDPPGAPPRDKGSYAMFSLPLEVNVREHDGVRFYPNTAEDFERIRTAQRINDTMYRIGIIYKKFETRSGVIFDKDEETVTFDARAMKVLDKQDWWRSVKKKLKG